MKLISFPIALMALTIAHSPAQAQEHGPRTRIVSYGDLDLADARDVATLNTRVSRAIVAVCGDPAPVSLHLSALNRRCRKETAQRVQVQVAEVVHGRREAVAIADLDLGRARDRQMLGHRLGIAVAQACGVGDGDARRPVRACRAELKSQLPVGATRVAARRAGPKAG